MLLPSHRSAGTLASFWLAIGGVGCGGSSGADADTDTASMTGSPTGSESDSSPATSESTTTTAGSSSTTATSASSATEPGTETAATMSTSATATSTTGTDSSSGESTDTDVDVDVAFRCGDPRVAMATPTFAAPVVLDAADGTGGTASGDLDGDGNAEFVSRILFRIYDWDGAQWQSFQPLANLNGRGDRFAGDIEVADLSGDGMLDIIVPDSDNAGSQGALSWFENPGSLAGVWVEHPITTFDGNGVGNIVTHLSELEVGDIDGDGWQDVVVRDISHGVWVLIRETGGGGWEPRKFIETLPREGLDLWDPDENGTLDILLNGVWLETPADPVAGDYAVHPLVGMEAWYAPDLSTPSIRDYACKVEAADFDGDGRLDVAITNAEELSSSSPNKPLGISVFLQPNDLLAGTWSEVSVTTENWSWHTLMIADYDFDGTPDILSAVSDVGTDNAGDQIQLWLNDGAGGGFAGQTISTEHTVYQGIIGDADGDGDCDLVAPDHFNSGPVRYFENLTVP